MGNAELKKQFAHVEEEARGNSDWGSEAAVVPVRGKLNPIFKASSRDSLCRLVVWIDVLIDVVVVVVVLMVAVIVV